MRILKENVAAVVVDIQERLLPHMHDGGNVLSCCLKLIEGLQLLDVPVLVTQQYTKGLGSTVEPVVNMFPDFRHTEKITFSCCDEPAFNDELNRLGKQAIIICGIETHVCVLQTCLDLVALGKKPVIVEDCVTSRKSGDKKAAIKRMRSEGAIITTMESILFELTRTAGNPTFKGISGIVK